MACNGLLALERPSFGQFARQLVTIPTDKMEEQLRDQSERGGRLGEIMKERGFITREQIHDILSQQAAWVAKARESDLKPHGFPYQSSFSLCMPAYNEELNIEDTLDAAIAILPHFVAEFEVVVVDDGSKDRTAEIVTEYSKRHPNVRLLRHEKNKGYGAAVTTALRGARGELIAFTDSDGQFSILDLPQLLAELPGNDFVIGFRHRRADSRVRLINAWCWGRLIRMMLGVKVKDLDCAFKVFRREVLQQVSLTTTGATINAEMMAQCFRRGFKFAEVPVTHWPRTAGQPTGAAFKVIAKAFRDLPKIWKYRYDLPANVDGVVSKDNAPMSTPSTHQVAGETVRMKTNLDATPMPEPVAART